MLTLEDAKRARPVSYGELVIKRDERPTAARGIVLPARARRSTRASMATVWSISNEEEFYRVGDRLLLAQGAGHGRRVAFGERGELRLEAISIEQVMMLIQEEVERGEEHPFATIAPRDRVIDEDEATTFDEGDPRAIQ